MVSCSAGAVWQMPAHIHTRMMETDDHLPPPAAAPYARGTVLHNFSLLRNLAPEFISAPRSRHNREAAEDSAA
jgi:hypothetical protein